jgi:toxin HigB-1
MILGCGDKRTERFYAGERVKEFESFADQARRRLLVLKAATTLDELRRLPSNRFEALGGDRFGEYSIRINRQWRVCFTWVQHDRPEQGLVPADQMLVPGDAGHVEIEDYH